MKIRNSLTNQGPMGKLNWSCLIVNIKPKNEIVKIILRALR